MESIFEVNIGVLLGIRAFIDENSIELFWQSRDDKINTVITVIISLLIIALIVIATKVVFCNY